MTAKQTNVSRETKRKEREDSIIKLFILVGIFFAAFVVAFVLFGPRASAQQAPQAPQAYLIVCPACGNSDRPASVIEWRLGRDSCRAAALNMALEGEAAEDGTWARCTPDNKDLEEAVAMQVEAICYNRKANEYLRVEAPGRPWTVQGCIDSMTPPKDED